MKKLFCTCKHEYQDKMFGKNKRLHNKMRPQVSTPKDRCTVCGKVKVGEK